MSNEEIGFAIIGAGMVARYHDTAIGRIPGALRFTGAERCDLLGNPQEALALRDGEVHLDLAPREIASVCLVGLAV